MTKIATGEVVDTFTPEGSRQGAARRTPATVNVLCQAARAAEAAGPIESPLRASISASLVVALAAGLHAPLPNSSARPVGVRLAGRATCVYLVLILVWSVVSPQKVRKTLIRDG